MDLTEYALSILKEHDCQEDAYAHVSVEAAEKDLKQVYPNGLLYGYSYSDVATELCRIGNAVPAPPNDYTSATGFNWENIGDFGHYGIFDGEDAFYQNIYKEIQHELSSNKDFNTGWHGFKKQLEGLKLSAFGDTILVEVSAYCDDMPYDLISDCDEGDKLTDDEIDYIYDMYCNSPEFNTEYTESGELPRSATIHDILQLASSLVDSCQSSLNETFMWVQSMVKDTLFMRGQE